MKVTFKRIFCLLLMSCMLIPLFPAMPVSAATEWTYEIYIDVCDKKDAGCGKKNAIQARLDFDGSYEYVYMTNTGRNKTAYASITTSRAPWTLDSIQYENKTKDSLWMHRTYINVKYSDRTKNILDYYYGTSGKRDTGRPIDVDDGGPKTSTVYFSPERKVNMLYLDNFYTELSSDIRLDPAGESGTVTKEWSGKINDNYADVVGQSPYYCMDLSDPPSLSVSVSGLKGDGAQISKNELEKNGITFLERGYKMDKAKLLLFMNNNNLNQIDLSYTLSFSSKSTWGTSKFYSTSHIYRNTFSLQNINFSTNYYTASKDNYYYNNQFEKTISVTANITNTKNYSMFSGNILNKKTLTFDRAYLKAGNKEIPAKNSSGDSKSVSISSGNVINLNFEYDSDIDTNDNGISLVFDNAKIEYNGVTYKLWDETNKKLGFSNQSNFDGYYMSTHKIDSQDPTVALTPADGTDLNKWNKTVSFNSVPSENIYSFLSNGTERTDGIYTMKLTDGLNSPNIYKYNYTEQNKGTAALSQKVPALKGSTTKITLALRDNVEGVYNLVLSGEDYAGNPLSTVYNGIKLDNKAPEVTLTETQKPKIDGKKGNVYNFTISDASGTGRLYYMFTEKNIAEAPEYDGSNNPTTSGEMDTTLDKWAYIEQKDTENNAANAYLDVEKGKSFSGHLMYFAVDEAGNKTNVFTKDINIQNEDTTYDITPKNVDKPLSSYNITIDTNTNNTVYYRWKNYIKDEKTGKMKENYITDYKKYSGGIDTANDAATKNLNGTYTLECKIVPPSNTNINYISMNYVFDNEGPSINITAPSIENGSKMQTIPVYATDLSDIVSATAKIVTPDGKDIDGFNSFDLNIKNGILSQSVNISDIPSGAYALSVTATDKNGLSASQTSDVFIIRADKPHGTVKISSDKSLADKPLISTESFKLDFDISESFENAAYAGNQELYYRISTTAGQYGEWISAGSIAGSSDALTSAHTVDAPNIALADGENTLFIQTAICHKDFDKTKIDLSTVKTDEAVFYYDRIAPTANLVIDDVHTNESITGTLYINDNLDGNITASCQNNAVEIGELSNGMADITVNDNTDDNTEIIVSDSAGNQTSVKLKISGIDRLAPTVDINVSKKPNGARKDAAATVKVNDVLGESVKFAFIPTDKYRDDKIPEEYFVENLADTTYYHISEARSEESNWSGEKNITYDVQFAGTTADVYLGIRAADSLGNSTDIIFKDNVLSATDAELTAQTTAKPEKTELKTVAQVTYNVPVYTLPQDKIVDGNSDIVKNNTLGIEDFDKLTIDKKVETANLELAKQYAISYSDKYLFAASDNGDYDLYTVDDLGRTKHLIATVSGIEFGAASEIKTVKAKRDWASDGTSTIVYYPDNEMICAGGHDQNYIIVESVDSNDDTLFLPIPENDSEYTNGLVFDSELSKDYASYIGEEPIVGENGEIETGGLEIEGYKKLVYEVRQIINEDVELSSPNAYADTTERIVSVRAFSKGADTTNPDEVSEKTTVITGIDNTAPIVTWDVSPSVYTKEFYEADGYSYYDWVVHPTPGDVTFTLNAQDKESGIEQINVLTYLNENDAEENVVVPMTDSNGNPTEYWSWDGSEHNSLTYGEWDESKQDYNKIISTIPIKIEYIGDGDKYGVKTILYTFSDVYTLPQAAIFTNSLGADGRAYIGRFEGGLSTEGLIYKMPIEEGTDYNVKYSFKNSEGIWEEFTDLTNTYYKDAKVDIEISEDGRGTERGLYVSNNSGVSEKVLNNYQNEFTFKLKDKYGYTKDAPVSLNNFDITSGTVKYELSNTAKTNKPYDINIEVSDEQSGVGTVTLTNGKGEIALTDLGGGKYRGTIAENGTYSITMYDKVGNKAVKSFNVKNINTKLSDVAVTYSTKEYTSHPVTATLSFAEPNVRITDISPIATLTESDYTVNYNSSAITFTKSGSVAVCYTDDYGNTNADDLLIVTVDNIDKAPPVLEAVKDNTTDPSVVSISFNKIDNLQSKMDMERKESEIYVTYGGMTKTVVDDDGNKNSFVFYQNGNYTFKVHDEEGRSSFLSVEINDIDTKAPKITSVSWSYDYEEFNGTDWVTKTVSDTKTPTDGKVGYTVAPDGSNKITNQDVNVTVETDDETRLVGSSDDYTTTKERIFDRNGMYIFNTEKKNGLTASYGVDIGIIDKTPPTIDLLGNNDLVFYENPEMNAEYDISMLKYTENGKYEAYKAYDIFNGKTNDLTSNVEVVSWGGFNPYDLSQNTFDSSKPYTITYRVSDSAHNITEAKRTVRLVGMYDTIALINGSLPDFAGRSEVIGDRIKISLSNFAGTAYVRYQSGVKTMGQMKKDGFMLFKNAAGEYETPVLDEGWYTFYIQTDKRDYFTLCVYLSK